MRVLIVGCGYVGVELGTQLAGHGHEVYGMRRNVTAATDLPGIRPIQGDITDAGSLAGKVAGFDWVVNAVSSSKGGAPEYRAVYLEGNRNLLKALAPSPPQKYVFTSSTSVYGQTDGGIVTEASPTEPASETSRILVESEQLALESQLPVIVLRVAGIYGPGRGHLFQQFLQDRATINGKGDRYLNRVHVADVAGSIAAVLAKGKTGEIYNVVDDEPVTELAFFSWLAEQLGKPLLPFKESDAQPRKRGITNKRVSNEKLKRTVDYRFRYPTFREGYLPQIKR